MKNQNEHSLPPVIRVFISSTFADMENERSYFNEVLVPRLNRICAERGVSFFSVDLRWGITEDEQVNGKVIPICLSEIDKCRPYFIGIIGNRYGSLMEKVPTNLGDSIPWIEGKEGRSITELEMLYAVLDKESSVQGAKYSSFYFRSSELSEKWYGHTEEDPLLGKLKERIKSDEDLTYSTYNSVEEFGEMVMRDILSWCDKEFPVPAKVREVRRAWYDKELLRNYIPLTSNHSFLDAYFRESSRSLLLYGNGEGGKTTLLSAWQPKQGSKILVNCGSDDAFRYWPAVAKEIIQQVQKIANVSVYSNDNLRRALVRGMMNSMNNQGGADDEDFYFNSEKALESFRLAFIEWISQLQVNEPLYIIINDLNLLDDEHTKMLSWLPAKCEGDIHFICSTNRDEMVAMGDVIGWNCKEMPLFTKEHALECVKKYLNIYGKNLSEAQNEKLSRSAITAYPGYLRTVSDFLINHGRFSNLDFLLDKIGGMKSGSELYPFLFDFALSDDSEKIKSAAVYVLGLLCNSPVSLTEKECNDLTSSYVNLTALEWSEVRNIAEQFHVVKGDYWTNTDNELAEFIENYIDPSLKQKICQALGDHFLETLVEYVEKTEKNPLLDVRKIISCAKAVIYAYKSSGNTEKLLAALGNEQVICYLMNMEMHTLRSAWLHLFLNTDIDVNKEIYSVFEKIHSKYGSNSPMTICVANLSVDFEIGDYETKIEEKMGDVKYYGTVNVNMDLWTKEFFPVIRKIYDVKHEGNPRKLYNVVCKLLENSESYNLSELCRVLYYKSECETRLHADAELMETANKYFETAVKAGNVFELQAAMSARIDALKRNKRSVETIELFKELKRVLLSQGRFRAYMNHLNTYGTALYDMNEYDDAIDVLTGLFELWNKKGEPDEANSIYLNVCNAYYLKGDVENALEKAESLYNEVKNKKGFEKTTVSILGNMGLYLYDLKRYDRAEECLTSALESAERMEMESTFLNASLTMCKLYFKTGKFMKGYELSEKVMELRWSRHEYPELMDKLEEACTFLQMCHHTRQIKGVREKWRKRFATLEGGEKYFDDCTSGSVHDARKIETLKESLAMAKSEGDPLKIALAYKDLAVAVSTEDENAYREYAYTAMELFKKGNFTDEIDNLVCIMLGVCFKNGIPSGNDELETILSNCQNKDIVNVALLWKSCGAYNSEYEASSGAPVFDDILEALLDYSESQRMLVFDCLCDVIEKIKKYAEAETAIKMTRSFPKEYGEYLSSKLVNAYLKTMQEDITKLKEDFMGFTAVELLAYYEKVIVYLKEFDSANTAALTGNLALIFRRRKEEEKTLYYHKLSMKSFLKLNNYYDYLIEKMNYATAHKEFKRYDVSIDILRESLKDAKEKGVSALEGAIAGNLAAMLRDHGEGDNHKEIMTCFEVEEKFFRDQGIARDLVISLINQVAYFHKRGEIESVLPKLKEAGELIRHYGFKEFYQVLSVLESFVSGNKKSSSDLTPEKFVEELLASNGKYRIMRIFEKDGKYNADCTLVDETHRKIYNTMIRIIFEAGVENGIVFMVAYLPSKYANGVEETYKKYIEWSNGLTFYKLDLHDNLNVQGGCRISAADFESLKERFAFYTDLWETDCLNFSVMALGAGDISMCMGMKLRKINGDEE